MPSTISDPWVNNTYSTKDEKFNAVIPDIGMDSFGMPNLPTGAFLPDTEVPWRDKRYELGIDKLLGAGTQYASALAKLEESRGRQAENTLRTAYESSKGPVMGQAEIDAAIGKHTDTAGRQYLDRMSSLRGSLGGAGIDPSSGLAAGLAATTELARMGQVTDARRDVFLEASKANALKAMQDFQNAGTLASVEGRSPSMIGIDWLTNVLGLRLQQQGVEKQNRAAREAAKASEKSGWMNLAGGLGGALIGAL